MSREIPAFSGEELQRVQYDLNEKAIDLHRQIVALYKKERSDETHLALRKAEADRARVLLGMLELRHKADESGTKLKGVNVILSTTKGEYEHPYMKNQVLFIVSANDTATVHMHIDLDVLSREGTEMSSLEVKALIGKTNGIDTESVSVYSERLTRELVKLRRIQTEGLGDDPTIAHAVTRLSYRLIDIRTDHPEVPLKIGIHRDQGEILFHSGKRPILKDGSIRGSVPAIPSIPAFETQVHAAGGFDFWVTGYPGPLSVIPNPQRQAV